MLLKKLLQQTSSAPNILFRDPFKAIGQAALIKEVIGLANVEFDGPRYIVFGVNKATMQGNGYVGIPSDQLADLKKAHRLVSMLVKPMVDLSFIYDELDGKIVGALEIDGCDEPPYVVRRNYADELVRGRSYIREGREIREASDTILQAMSASAGLSKEWNIALGLGTNYACDFLEVEVPDTSDPPSARLKHELERKFDWKQATVEAIGTLNTNIVKLMTGRHRRVAEPAESEEEALALFQKAAERGAAEADNFYFFEERAVRLQLTLRNNDAADLKDVKLSVALPKSEGFVVVDRLHTDPKDKSDPAAAARYPKVRSMEQGIVVTVELGTVAANSSRSVFATPLRLAVGRAMHAKKIGIHYSLQASNKEPIERGRLKMRFSVAASPATSEDIVVGAGKGKQPAAVSQNRKPRRDAGLPAVDAAEVATSTIVLDDLDADAIVEADAAREAAESA